jgi:predicted N-acyltransferase
LYKVTLLPFYRQIKVMLACNLNKIELSNNIGLKSEEFTVSFSQSISDLTTDWNEQAGSNLFLNAAFLSALEAAPPSGTSYRYGLVSKKEQQVGIVYFQLKKINLFLSLRLDAYKPSGFVDRVWHGIKSFLAKRINQYVLVNGNMTLTGNNGFLFSDSIGDEDKFSLVDEISDQLVCKLRKEKIKVKAILLKDYRSEEKANKEDWDFSEFQVQPNMIMKIDQEWTSFEDYIMAMRSKYRVRVRRARKKAESLEKRQLSLEEIHSYAEDISNLYKNVADQAGFNLFILPKNYFYSLQKQLGEHMKLVAYFEEGKMVGYYTHIINGGELDAHFLGYDSTCNKNCQLYLNMLYDLVDDAIQLKAHNLILSRTAMEIKSSIGAEAHDMFLYMRMINPLLNKGVSAALDYFKPKAEWQPRSPFK